jgi:hypothetical protein
MIARILSGGQTGADRAALDFAIERGIPHGGWIPRGRRTEEGPLPDRYRLREMETIHYGRRTERNILDSDGTLIISRGTLTGGSSLTRRLARSHRRPLLHIDLNRASPAESGGRIRAWIRENGIRVLNVAGPRASQDPGIYRAAREVLNAAFAPGEKG